MRRTTLAAAAALLCGAIALVALFSGSAQAQFEYGGIVDERSSLYHQIFVFRHGNVVTLLFGRQRAGTAQSQVDVTDLRRHMFEYTRMTFCGLFYHPEPERVLVLGLGGGVIPREMHHYFPNALVDVAEIDPEVQAVAEKFFGFQTDERLRVHIGDGRVFVREQGRKVPLERYDLVVLDAFNSDYIPFHLMTREFIEQVKAITADDGVVVANVFSNNELCLAELKTFAAVFGRCQVYVGKESGNAMIVSPGPKGPIVTVEGAVARAEELQKKHNFSFDLSAVARMLDPYILPDPRAEVLTDDKAPVNWLREQETKALTAP
jgi:spermidine synthase